MNQQQKESTHDIFTDPALLRTADEDPFFKYIVENWRRILVTAVVIFGGYYVYTKYQSSQIDSRMAAADLYLKTQESSQELANLESNLARLGFAKDGKSAEEIKKEREDLTRKITEAKEKFSQRVAALADARQPYGDLAAVYRGINAAKSGDVASARSALTAAIAQFSNKADTASVFFKEVSELMLARVLLDDPASIGEAREKLRDLCLNGSYVHVSAALSLARVSVTEEERKSALEALSSLIQKHPEQSDLLKEEIARLS